MLHAGRLAARMGGASAVLALAVTLSTAGPAAAVNDWSNVDDLDRAKLQACKVSADGGDAWKIKLRVKNGNDYRVKSTVRVYDGETATDSRWGSGWVRRGDTSAIGSVTMGRTETWELQYAFFADQLGTGGGVRADAIGRC